MNDITISGQITLDDVAVLHAQGIKTLVNNRPDGEDPTQPTSESIAQACAKYGMAYQQIAFAGGMMDMNHVQAFADFFNAQARPLHLFCRSGSRSATLLAKARELDLLDE